MKRNSIHPVLAISLLFSGLALFPARSMAQVSLRTVVDLAQRNSSDVKLASADVDKARAALSETRDAFIPSLQFSTGIPAFPEIGFTGQPPSIFTVTMQSLVYSIPQKHYISAARTGLNAANLHLKDALEQAALDASTAYIELDSVNQQLEVAKQQQALADRLVEIEEQRAEAGVDPQSEWLQAKLTRANIKLARLHLETRAETLAQQLATLTALPVGSITPDHASIPEIPAVHGDTIPRTQLGIESARLQAHSREQQAKGDKATNYYPQLGFFAQYNRNTTILNDVNQYFNPDNPLPTNNFASGFNISVPLFDMVHRAKGRESAAEALRSRVEAEQAERQNDIVIAQLTGALRELDTRAEIASLKQQIAADQLKTVKVQLENPSGGNNQPQTAPKAGQLAQIDERQKQEDALQSSFELSKVRLQLLRALGHITDWLNEVHAK